jgi:hypothetical protein
MKKLIIGLAAFAVTLGGLTSVAQVTQTSSAIDVFINDADFKEAVIAEVNKIVADLVVGVADLNASIPQVDTNATTTVTLYTPTKLGSLLIGKQGGSNRVWIATGLTTNDWGAKVLNN